MMWLISAAWAHRPGLSYAHVGDDTLTLTFAKPELAAFAPMDDLAAARVLLHDATLAKVRLTPCEIGEPSLRAVEGDGVEIAAPIACEPGPRTYDAGFLARMEPGHRHVVASDAGPVATLDVAHPTATLDGTSHAGEVALAFTREGIAHIWAGYDHLLFLAGLLLAAPGLRAMLLVVTGFTLAHSITLSLAATGVLTLPPSLVEPAIAASIAYVGIENFWNPTPKRRALVTFALGLVHGFGFAGALAELGLPRGQLAVALATFNLGVELGQAAVVALVLPLLLWLRRWPWWQARAVPAASIGVTVAGLWWLVERVSEA
ncbi:MAG: HupE/UreJ family protein [Myxococcota bacterium]